MFEIKSLVITTKMIKKKISYKPKGIRSPKLFTVNILIFLIHMRVSKII